MPGARRRARNIALQLLYEIDVSGHNYLQTVNHTEGYCLLSEENRQFVFDIVSGIDKHQQEIDACINRFAPAWPVSQLAVIDRNILRLAIYELLYVKTPVKVAINEAVELAKAFGSSTSSRFINGVLSSVNVSIAGSGDVQAQ